MIVLNADTVAAADACWSESDADKDAGRMRVKTVTPEVLSKTNQ